MNCLILLLLILSVFVSLEGKEMLVNVNPPHCTQVSKTTDYQGNYKYDYPVAYIPPGQREAYQQLFCINPPMIHSASTVVCDWAAPPQVQFTIGDNYMYVLRVDPTGRYSGNAVIVTNQICYHSRVETAGNATSAVSITKVDARN